MAQLKNNLPDIVKVSEDDGQVTYKFKSGQYKNPFSGKSHFQKKVKEHSVTLLLFDELIIDKIQEALDKLLVERRAAEKGKDKSVLKSISTFLLR